MGGTAPAWLSAANEVAVEAFLAGRIAWPAIAATLDTVLQEHPGDGASIGVDDIIEADAAARRAAADVLTRTC
jgi:1-deoxy-D-xylulose-5-phosphate reductoisomerase